MQEKGGNLDIAAQIGINIRNSEWGIFTMDIENVFSQKGHVQTPAKQSVQYASAFWAL